MRQRLRGDARATNNRWRSVALLAIGFALATLAFATPAPSHVGGTVDHLWKHLRPKTDARYHTKQAADAKFVDEGAAAGGDLAGTYPSPTIADDAIGSAQIENRQVSGADIVRDAIGSAHIKDREVASEDIRDGGVAAADLQPGSVGAVQLRGNVVFHSSSVVVPGNTPENGNYTTRGTTAQCGTGETPLFGGAGWPLFQSADNMELTIVSSRLWQGGWYARGGNDSSQDAKFEVYVACLK